jgi:hypothetical protein
VVTVATWTVTGVLSNQYGSDGSGTPVLGKEISFMTGNGNRDSVFLPNDKVTVAAVRKAIEARAVLIDEVAVQSSTG